MPITCLTFLHKPKLLVVLHYLLLSVNSVVLLSGCRLLISSSLCSSFLCSYLCHQTFYYFDNQLHRTRLVCVFKNWKLLFKNICRNTCEWKSVLKCVKYCLKTENDCLKTQTKHPHRHLEDSIAGLNFWRLNLRLYLYSALSNKSHTPKCMDWTISQWLKKRWVSDWQCWNFC